MAMEEGWPLTGTESQEDSALIEEPRNVSKGSYFPVAVVISLSLMVVGIAGFCSLSGLPLSRGASHASMDAMVVLSDAPTTEQSLDLITDRLKDIQSDGSGVHTAATIGEVSEHIDALKGCLGHCSSSQVAQSVFGIAGGCAVIANLFPGADVATAVVELLIGIFSPSDKSSGSETPSITEADVKAAVESALDSFEMVLNTEVNMPVIISSLASQVKVFAQFAGGGASFQSNEDAMFEVWTSIVQPNAEQFQKAWGDVIHTWLVGNFGSQIPFSSTCVEQCPMTSLKWAQSCQDSIGAVRTDLPKFHNALKLFKYGMGIIESMCIAFDNAATNGGSATPNSAKYDSIHDGCITYRQALAAATKAEQGMKTDCAQSWADYDPFTPDNHDNNRQYHGLVFDSTAYASYLITGIEGNDGNTGNTCADFEAYGKGWYQIGTIAGSSDPGRSCRQEVFNLRTYSYPDVFAKMGLPLGNGADWGCSLYNDDDGSQICGQWFACAQDSCSKWFTNADQWLP